MTKIRQLTVAAVKVQMKMLYWWQLNLSLITNTLWVITAKACKHEPAEAAITPMKYVRS